MAEVISIDTLHPHHPVKQIKPTAAQQFCAWYQDGDGECSVDCIGCPGKAYLAEQRARCGQSVFGGCAGPDCDRSCSATVNTDIIKAHRATSAWELLGWAVVIWVILAGAWSIGLSREAPHYEISERM